jgi:hypothetical protein
MAIIGALLVRVQTLENVTPDRVGVAGVSPVTSPVTMTTIKSGELEVLRDPDIVMGCDDPPLAEPTVATHATPPQSSAGVAARVTGTAAKVEVANNATTNSTIGMFLIFGSRLEGLIFYV